ncbi:MAG: hypothetical protein EZS28_053492, partial [Streblomastix strix]
KYLHYKCSPRQSYFTPNTTKGRVTDAQVDTCVVEYQQWNVKPPNIASNPFFVCQYILLTLSLSQDSNGTNQLNGEPSSSNFQTLDRQMLSTQGEGITLQGGTYFQGGIAERVSDHVLLNSKGLCEGMNLEDAQQKRSQTELSSYETMNVDSVTPSTQGKHAFTWQMCDARSQQLDLIHMKNLIIAGNTFLSQQTMENVDPPSSFLQDSLAVRERTLVNGLKQCSESSPYNVGREGS